jgi:hypothetical protein
MTCTAAIYPFILSCGCILLVALASLLLYSSDKNSSNSIFAAVILAASLLSLIINLTLTAFNFNEPYQSHSPATGDSSGGYWLSRIGIFSLSIIVITLAANVINNETSIPVASEANQSNISFAAALLVISCVSALVTGILLTLEITKLCHAHFRRTPPQKVINAAARGYDIEA